jgi:hypothetical protein
MSVPNLNTVLVVSCRMSTEMVACIAVESISILEKMHSRGYFLVSGAGSSVLS